MGDSVNVCVPTGNFGNILAAYIARPHGSAVCAPHLRVQREQRPLTDFIKTGVYDRNPISTARSPRRWISLFPPDGRLLYYISGGDCAYVAGKMRELAETGRYALEGPGAAGCKASLAGFCDDEATARTICEVWEQNRHLIDTHTPRSACASCAIRRPAA